MRLNQQLAFMRACGRATSLPAPRDLILAAHQKGAAACRLGNRDGAARAIAALVSLLDFQAAPQLAADLLVVYRYCVDLLTAGRFGQASAVLEKLAVAWAASRSRAAA